MAQGVSAWLARHSGYLVALCRLEGYADSRCLYSHNRYLELRVSNLPWEGDKEAAEYERGRADAYTDILEYIAKLKETRGPVPD